MKNLIEFCKSNGNTDSIMNTTNLEKVSFIFDEEDGIIPNKSSNTSTSILFK